MSSVWGAPWAVWAVLFLVIGIVNTVLWPRPKNNRGPYSPWQYLILRWFHGLVWILLAISCVIRPLAVLGGGATANMLAALALGVYVVFMGTLLSSGASRR